MKTIPLHLQLFTVFLNWVKSDRPEEWWIDFFERIRTVGIKYIEYMPYVIERKGLYQTIQPFRKFGKLFNLALFRILYWKKLRKFLKLTKKAHIKMIPVMWSKYQETPFRRGKNINGATGLFSKKALKFECKFTRKLMRITAKIYVGFSWARLSNEIWHHGDHARGALIARTHEAWYEITKKYLPLKNVKNDITFSDFTMLTEKHYLLWNGSMVRASDYTGDPNEIRAAWGRDEYDRLNWAQLHGMPQKLDQITEGKPWREHIANHTSIKKWDLSTDGCNQGSGYKIPGTPYCNMNEAEIKVFATEVWGYKKKKVVISELPKEVFYRDKNGVVADDMARLYFGRLEVYAEVWEGIKEG